VEKESQDMTPEGLPGAVGQIGRNDGSEDTGALYAWLVREDGVEGIITGLIGGLILPLVSGDEHQARALEPFARDAARVHDQPVRLVRFARERTLVTRPPAASN
jgi:hypothetical protein